MSSLPSYTQLTGHTSFETAFEYSQFPYSFGQQSTIRVWTSSQEKGDRLVYSVFNPHLGTWTKAKETPHHSLVFLFANQHGADSFIHDQIVDLGNLPVETVLYIAQHYYTTPEQKSRIAKYLCMPDMQRLLETNNLKLVWLDEHGKVDENDAFNVVPFTFPASSIVKPTPEAIMPEAKIVVKKPVGRPKQVVTVANAQVGQPLTPGLINVPPINCAAALVQLQSTEQSFVQSSAMQMINYGDPVTRETLQAFYEDRLKKIWDVAAKEKVNAIAHRDEAIANPDTSVNLGLDHSDTNNHTRLPDHWDRVIAAADKLHAYIRDTFKIYQQQLDEYPF